MSITRTASGETSSRERCMAMANSLSNLRVVSSPVNGSVATRFSTRV